LSPGKPWIIRKLKVRTRYHRARRKVSAWWSGGGTAELTVADELERTDPVPIGSGDEQLTVTSPASDTASQHPAPEEAPGPVAQPSTDPDSVAVLAEVEALMGELERSAPPFQPTSFWAPAVRQLIDELTYKGLSRFKSWSSAQQFFYPRYGQGFTTALLEQVGEFAAETNPESETPWVTSRLSGGLDAHRDLDIALGMIDRSVIDFDFLSNGESEVGIPPQRFRLAGPDGPAYGRPYLNYAKILAAYSRVADSAPRRVLELGGGFGVLGELLHQFSPDTVYVDVDIPPLTSIAGWYLRTVIDGKPTFGPIDALPGPDDPAWVAGFAASLPSWRLPECRAGSWDLFVNAFSFQEMEPDTVAAYADLVAEISPRYVVSQNSRAGKPLATAEREVGVTEQTTSDMIVAAFERHDFRVIGRFDRPACPPQAELVVLERS
jgi:putative sugar O-methyltransferase